MFLLFIFKLYIIVLLFRVVCTRPELNFNNIGLVIRKLTDPLFKLFKIKEKHVKLFVILCILVLIIISALVGVLFEHYSLVNSIIGVFVNYFQFFMLFFMVCIILGSMANKIQASSYITYFYRLGLPWVKITRKLVPIHTGKIIYPSIIFIFIVYLVLAGLFTFLYGISNGDEIHFSKDYILVPLRSGLLSVTTLIMYAVWVFFIRAILSWCRPNFQNPFVQLIYVLTEPLLNFCRKFVPTIGLIDISSIICIVVLYVIKIVLQRLIILI